MRILHGKALKNPLDSRVDIGIVLTPLDGLENMWARVGYFQQHYSDMTPEWAYIPAEIATRVIDIV